MLYMYVIILSDLAHVKTCAKYKKNTYFQTSSERLNTIQKEYIYISRHYGCLLAVWNTCPTLAFAKAGRCQKYNRRKIYDHSWFWSFLKLQSQFLPPAHPKQRCNNQVGLDQRVLCYLKLFVSIDNLSRKRNHKRAVVTFFKGPCFRHVYGQQQTPIYTTSPCFSFNCCLVSILTT